MTMEQIKALEAQCAEADSEADFWSRAAMYFSQQKTCLVKEMKTLEAENKQLRSLCRKAGTI